MIAEALEHACRPWLQDLDPRLRIVFAVVFAFLVAMATALPVAAAGLGLGLGAFLLSGLPYRVLLKRHLPLNIMLIVLVLLLVAPQLGIQDSALYLEDSAPVQRALLLVLKANAILLVITVFFSTLPPIVLGHSLERLHFPKKLTRLLLFTVRYLDVMHLEFQRLRDAMRVRGFNPQANLHTVRAYANLVGMLLVRALDRAERIEAAMACRGFTGHFPVAQPLQYQSRDIYMALLLSTLVGVLGFLELWSWR